MLFRKKLKLITSNAVNRSASFARAAACSSHYAAYIASGTTHQDSLV